MAQKSTNTQTEALQKMLGTIADMKTMPDADLSFLTNLETVVLGYLRAPYEQQQQQISALPGMGTPPGVGPGMGAPSPMGGASPLAAQGARVPGILNRAPMPPVDELRRLLSA